MQCDMCEAISNEMGEMVVWMMEMSMMSIHLFADLWTADVEQFLCEIFFESKHFLLSDAIVKTFQPTETNDDKC